jgi:hypothetical protein
MKSLDESLACAAEQSIDLLIMPSYCECAKQNKLQITFNVGWRLYLEIVRLGIAVGFEYSMML